MRYLKLLYSLILYSLFFILPSQAQEKPTPRAIIDQMLSSIDRIKSLKFKLLQEERIGDKLIASEKDIKLTLSPMKVYIYNYFPDKGAELLWVEGNNNADALVNPNSFPYFNLNLNPYGKILRKNQHHTIFELGFDYLAQVIKTAMSRVDYDIDKYCEYQGTVIWKNIACHKLVIEYDDFKYVPYTVQQGETVVSIAKKLNVGEYMILQSNPEADYYDVLKQGQQIKVPNAYSKKTILYIDKRNNLPIVQMMYDEKGLYEKYEFHNLQVNPDIPEEEFTNGYKGYGF